MRRRPALPARCRVAWAPPAHVVHVHVGPPGRAPLKGDQGHGPAGGGVERLVVGGHAGHDAAVEAGAADDSGVLGQPPRHVLLQHQLRGGGAARGARPGPPAPPRSRRWRCPGWCPPGAAPPTPGAARWRPPGGGAGAGPPGPARSPGSRAAASTASRVRPEMRSALSRWFRTSDTVAGEVRARCAMSRCVGRFTRAPVTLLRPGRCGRSGRGRRGTPAGRRLPGPRASGPRSGR